MVNVNGEQKDLAGRTVTDLLSEMGLVPERTAVMIGGNILPKSDYGRSLVDGDEVDIVGFVGGG